MKNSTNFNYIFIFVALLMMKFAIVSATDEDDDDAMTELIEDITAGLIGAAVGVCSESPECSSIMYPAIIVSLLICALCSCICPSDDYDDYHRRRFRYRTAGAGFAGYTFGRLFAKNW